MDAFEAWREDHPRYDEKGERYYSGTEEANLIGAFVSDVFGNAGTDIPEERFKSIVDDFVKTLATSILHRRHEIMGEHSGALH